MFRLNWVHVLGVAMVTTSMTACTSSPHQIANQRAIASPSFSITGSSKEICRRLYSQLKKDNRNKTSSITMSESSYGCQILNGSMGANTGLDIYKEITVRGHGNVATVALPGFYTELEVTQFKKILNKLNRK